MQDGIKNANNSWKKYYNIFIITGTKKNSKEKLIDHVFHPYKIWLFQHEWNLPALSVVRSVWGVLKTLWFSSGGLHTPQWTASV